MTTSTDLAERLHAERSATRTDVTIGIDEVDGASAGFVGVGSGPTGFGEHLTVGVDPEGLAHITAGFGEHHVSVGLPWDAVVEMIGKVNAFRPTPFRERLLGFLQAQPDISFPVDIYDDVDLARFVSRMLRGECRCHLEIGDNPCPVHPSEDDE